MKRFPAGKLGDDPSINLSASLDVAGFIVRVSKPFGGLIPASRRIVVKHDKMCEHLQDEFHLASITR